MESFKVWLEMGFGRSLAPNAGDLSRRADVMSGGIQTYDEDMPMGMKSMMTPITSAYPTYSLPKKKRKLKIDPVDASKSQFK
jgi:hypothetical protein